MGWATYLTTTLTFNRETYKSKYEVETAIEENKDMINYYKSKLYNLAVMTEPQKMMPKDCEEPLWWIQKEFEEYYEGLTECIVEGWKLSILLDEWDKCHDSNGKPIKRELSIQYVDGDERRCYYGSKESCIEKFNSLKNDLPVPLIDGDFIFEEDKN